MVISDRLSHRPRNKNQTKGGRRRIKNEFENLSEIGEDRDWRFQLNVFISPQKAFQMFSKFIES